MADDIMGKLFSSYNDAATNIDSDKSAVNTAVGKTVATKSMSEYKKEMEEIKKIRNAESDRYKELFKSELELGKYSQKVKSDLLQQENSHYNDVFNLRNDLHKKQVTVLEQERNIRAKIAESGKASLGDLAQLYTKRRELEELEKQSLQYKEQQFKKGVDKVKHAFGTIIQHVMTYVNEWDNLMRWNQWETGIKELGANYEKDFTEIAGRNGSDTQMETHNLIGNTLDKVINDSELVKGLNFNKEVFPEITKAVQKGFMGEEATDVAISNAIDKKITPWLDTSSETWVNLQYQLSDDMLAQLKGQQLLLQETREGNRILQNGVVSALLDELAPTLLNIDANTTDVTSLSGQAQSMVASLMDNGYSKQDAIKVANQTIDAYQNPFKNLSGNSSSWQKLLAIGGLQGGDLASAMDFATTAISPFNNGTWQAGGAVEAGLGVPTNGFTRNTNYIDDLKGAANAAMNYTHSGNLAGVYETRISNLNELTTATQQHDNTKQNLAAEAVFDKNLQVHGVDLAAMQLRELKEIKTWLITGLIAGLVTSLGNKLIDKGISKLGGKLFGKTAGGGNASILGSMGGGGASGALPTANTSAFASSNPILSKLGGGLATGASGSTAAGLATLGGAAAGIGMAVYGGYQAYNEFSQIGKGSETDEENKNHAVSGGLAAGGAAAGAIGTGALLAFGASNPIGWAALAVGGLALAGKAAYDHATRLSGLAEQYEIYGDQLKESFRQEQSNKIQETAFLKERIQQTTTDEEARKEIISAGLISEQTARDLTTTELTNMTNELIKTQSAITALGEAAIDAKTKVAKEEAQQQTKDVLDDTYNNIKALLGKDNVVKQGDEEYAMIKSMFEGMASSITNDEERKLMEEQLSTMFAEGEFDLEELKILMNKGGNARAFWHTTMDRSRNFYDYAMDVENANAYLGIIDGNGRYDLTDVNIDQSTAAWQVALDKYYDSYKSAKDDATKEMYKNQFLDTWNTNIKTNAEYYDYLKPKYKSKASDMGIKEFRIGSSFIPEDMMAMLHQGERVLTAEQNKQYTQDLMTSEIDTQLKQDVRDIRSILIGKTQNNNPFTNLTNSIFAAKTTIGNLFSNFTNKENNENNTDTPLNLNNDLTPLTESVNTKMKAMESLNLDVLNRVIINDKESTKINQLNDSDFTTSSTPSIIQAGVQDIVMAIKTQTNDIINYLSNMSFNMSTFGSNTSVNMLPTMGNTKVTV